VNQEGSGDMYSKAGNMLHTIRQLINDDEKFRSILRGLNKEYYHKTVNSSDIEKYFSDQSGIDLSKVFDQYLRTIKIPVLEYKTVKNKTQVRWTNCVEGFNMKLKLEGRNDWIYPTTEWKTIELKQAVRIDPNFYITVKKVS
jgi:aminopeptidase N